MVLDRAGTPLQRREVDRPRVSATSVVIRMEACGVCRTDLHVVDGELANGNYPIIPGHQIVGVVEDVGSDVRGFQPGDRVGVPWLAKTCGTCRFCRRDRENLCDDAAFTGFHVNGGFAEYAAADSRYVFAMPTGIEATSAAPLLCAGLIGYRALKMTADAEHVGLYGFGAAAHIVAQVARYQGRHIYAFTRPGDAETQTFARGLGAVWAGGSDQLPPRPLDAAILFAPVGALVPVALRAVDKGGVVVCAGIHMSDIPSFAYSLLWQERTVRSVANLTRRDGYEFFELAPQAGVHTSVVTYALSDAGRALDDLREGRFDGAAVLVPDA